MHISGKDIQLFHRELRGPRAVPKTPKPGCARFPLCWHGVARNIDTACDDSSLQVAWDVALSQIELELLARHDVVGTKAEAFVGACGPVEFEIVKLQWQPQQ
eukprot:6171845-Pyramimonas_sp.AAC.1